MTEISLIRISNTTSNDEKVAAIVKNLAERGQSKPRKTKTLANTINSLFTQKMDKNELSELITKLQEQNCIKVNQGNITYKLPKNP